MTDANVKGFLRRNGVQETGDGGQDGTLGALIVAGPADGPIEVSSAGSVTVASATVTQVASSASSVTLKAANTARKGLSVFNDSAQVLYLKLGSAASATSYTVKMLAGNYWEMPPAVIYTGIVTGIWASADGNAYVTEL